MSQIKELFRDLNNSFDEFRNTQEGRLDTFADDIGKLNDRLDDLQLDGQRQGFGGTGAKETKEQKEYKSAVFEYAKRGINGLSGSIQNTLSVGSAPDGGFWIPATVSQKIITKLFETSPLRRVANITSIPTDRWEAPKDVNDATSGGWVGETASRAATATPEVGIHEIALHEQYAMPKSTQKLIDMMGYEDFEKWIVDKTVQKIKRTENTAFVSGSGVMQPRGFTDYSTALTTDENRAWGTLQHIVSGKSGDFKVSGSGPADCLIDMVFALNDAYLDDATWIMKRTTLAEISKMKDSNDNYILNIASGLNENVRSVFNLLGFPVILGSDMPAYNSADNLAVAFGDFGQGYQIVDHSKGLSLLVDPYTAKPYVNFYITKYVGADVVNFDAIKLLKMST